MISQFTVLKLLYLIYVMIKDLTNAQQTFTFLNSTVFVRIINNGNYSNFYYTSSLTGLSSIDKNDAWLAIALSNNQLMQNSYPYICRYSFKEKSIQQYFISSYNGPILLEDKNPFFPLFDVSVSVIGGNLSCSFSRWNVYLGKEFYELYQLTSSRKPYILVAYGSGNISYHNNKREASSYPADMSVSFYLTNLNSTGNGTNSKLPIDTASITSFFNSQKGFFQQVYRLVLLLLNFFGIKINF